jgi:predicted DNA binding CopG/RHH family protein
LDPLNGESSRGFIMNQPKINDLKIDRNGTSYLRGQMAKIKKVKITINLDADLLVAVRKTAATVGAPYQTYLNHMIREALSSNKTQETRIKKIEKELARIKKRLAA